MFVAPSILSANFNNLKDDIANVEEGGAQFLHIDVMDGHFVPNITIGSCVVKSIRDDSNLIFDVHLMITNPEKYYKDFINAGADVITFHYEASSNPLELIKEIKALGIKAGISIKPETKVEEIMFLLNDVDLVLIMSVSPGFGGQTFKENALDKILYLKKYKEENNKEYLIEVDGGINLETGKLCKEKGVDILVAGSYIFHSKNPLKALENLLNL